jgi:hypothetical protein
MPGSSDRSQLVGGLAPLPARERDQREIGPQRHQPDRVGRQIAGADRQGLAETHLGVVEGRGAGQREDEHRSIVSSAGASAWRSSTSGSNHTRLIAVPRGSPAAEGRSRRDAAPGDPDTPARDSARSSGWR